MTYTADQKPDGLDAASALAAADLYVVEQGGVVLKATHTHLMTAIIALLGDADGTLAANSASKFAVQSAVKTYVDGKVAGLSWKQSVRAASTANVAIATALINGLVMDGVTLATGDRALLKNQTAPAENGIYIVAASGAASRATDADSAAELLQASLYVQEGTAAGDKQFVMTTDAPITLGTTALTFSLLSTGGGGDASTNTSSSVDAEVALFSGTGGKTLKRATGSGLLKLASGVASTVPQLQVIPIAVGDETTALAAGTSKVTFRMPFAFTLAAVRASLTEAATGATLLTVDVNESGTTILSAKLTFDASETTTTTAAAAPVISDPNLADDAEMTVDIDAVGSTLAGKGLKVYLIGWPA